MAIFEYKALTAEDRLMEGSIEASSLENAKELLTQMQLKINSIQKAKPRQPVSAIGRNEFLLFNQQLASIAKAGIPLEKGLRELSKDINSAKMKRLIDEIATELENGTGIEQAFEKRKKNFPPLYGRILKAGVETGRLPEMLTSLNRHIEVSTKTRKIIFEAISYPATVLFLAVILVTFVFRYVVPQFKLILTEMLDGERLNLMTRSVFIISDNIWLLWLAIVAVAGLVILTWSLLSATPKTRRTKESIILKLPVIGNLYRNSVSAKLSEAMAMMVSAGCDMPMCLRLGCDSAASEKMILEGGILASQIEQGSNILEAGQFCKSIPRLLLYSVQMGSQRNELQDNLYSLGQMYLQQVEGYQNRLQIFLPPLIIVTLGIVIFFIILAIFLPMIQIITGMAG
ncbi:MAG: type II secretion system F family protein [Planctomycetes bacterium]|nr:type II secretion system F family protein [Planctomycetota bacterium]